MPEHPNPNAPLPVKEPAKVEEKLIPWALAAVILVYLPTHLKDAKTGLVYWPEEIFWGVVVIIVLAFAVLFAIRNFEAYRKKVSTVAWEPFDPDKHWPKIRSDMLKRYGLYLDPRPHRYMSGPEFGRDSAENAHTTHIIARATDNQGKRFLVTLGFSNLWRNVFKFEPYHSHVETPTHSWSGERKVFEVLGAGYARQNIEVKPRPIPELEAGQEADEDEE